MTLMLSERTYILGKKRITGISRSLLIKVNPGTMFCFFVVIFFFLHCGMRKAP